MTHAERTDAELMDAELEAHYRRYIGYLNSRRTDELGNFVQDERTYNGKSLTRRDYQTFIADDVATIPDLYFDVHLLVVNANRVAARIIFDCTPQRTFRGLEPTGKKASFAEHVFYRFQDGKIAEVWSLLDQRAIEAQLAA